MRAARLARGVEYSFEVGNGGTEMRGAEEFERSLWLNTERMGSEYDVYERNESGWVRWKGEREVAKMGEEIPMIVGVRVRQGMVA